MRRRAGLSAGADPGRAQAAGRLLYEPGGLERQQHARGRARQHGVPLERAEQQRAPSPRPPRSGVRTALAPTGLVVECGSGPAVHAACLSAAPAPARACAAGASSMLARHARASRSIASALAVMLRSCAMPLCIMGRGGLPCVPECGAWRPRLPQLRRSWESASEPCSRGRARRWSRWPRWRTRGRCARSRGRSVAPTWRSGPTRASCASTTRPRCAAARRAAPPPSPAPAACATRGPC